LDPRQKQTLDRLRQHLGKLPLLPGVVMELVKLSDADPRYFEKVVALVESDPGYATKLLSLANSAAMTGGRSITRLGEAVARVGLTATAQLVTAASALQVFVPRDEWQRGIWIHSIETAAIARHLGEQDAAHRPVDPDELYLAGLMHDVGRFVLYLEAPDELRLVDEADWATPQELIDSERRLCGFTHAELGYQAGLKWHLPLRITNFIRVHHDHPATVPDPAIAALVDVVRTADWISVVLIKNPAWRALPLEALRALFAARRIRDATFFSDGLLDGLRRVLDESARAQITLGLRDA
jgi:HD-like signal output (HDOD) protein